VFEEYLAIFDAQTRARKTPQKWLT